MRNFSNPARLIDEVTHFSKEWSGYYVYEVEDRLLVVLVAALRQEGVGSVYVLYLDPTEKRKGYGSQLLNHFTLIQKQTEGIRHQTVSVAEHNQMGITLLL